MVEMNAQITDEFNKMVIEAINNQSTKTIEEQSRLIEQYEELKSKVKPKILVASRELADLANIFSAFQAKHQDNGRPVFTRTIEFYLKALKFESNQILGGLEEEINILKRDMEKIN